MTTPRKLSILGSTGSVGRSTLEVAALAPDIEVFALSAHSNVQLLAAQCAEHQPQFAVIADESRYLEAKQALDASPVKTELLAGSEALSTIAAHPEVELVMAAIVGGAGLDSSLAAVAAGKQLLLANKEALVMSGELFMATARRNAARILPIDSEHNGVFQCLPTDSDSGAGIEQITLTASGGPLLNLPLDEFARVTPEQACKHPRWSMGRKISVDSASMMNKGLEVIEASYLFGLPAEQIGVLVHPQSIVHGLVHYRDGSVLAQLANPDMRVPIAHGLGYPQRRDSGAARLDLAALADLQFLPPDMERFPCLKLGIEAVKQGGNAPVVLNAANEIAVDGFLHGRIKFDQIAQINAAVLAKIPCEAARDLAIIRAVDKQARTLARELMVKL